MTEPLDIIAPLVQPAVVAIIAAWLTHFFRERSELQRTQKQYLAEKLEEAYKLLVDSIESPETSGKDQIEKKVSLQKAINTLDLYADRKIKDLAVRIIQQYEAKADWVVYIPLMTALRDKFRDEMKFDRLSEPIHFIKFEAANQDANDARDGSKGSGN